MVNIRGVLLGGQKILLSHLLWDRGRKNGINVQAKVTGYNRHEDIPSFSMANLQSMEKDRFLYRIYLNA